MAKDRPRTPGDAAPAVTDRGLLLGTLKHLSPGVFVRHCLVGLCEVIDLDLDAEPESMPVEFKCLATHEVFTGRLGQVTHVLLPVDRLP